MTNHALLLLLTACGPLDRDPDDDADVDPSVVEDPAIIPDAWPPTPCDALNPGTCALPWPSDLYLAPDPDTPTGVRLTFDPQALPESRGGARMVPDLFDDLDGYGLGVAGIFDLGPVDLDLLPDEWSGLPASVAPGSRSLLLRHTPTGLVPVPHFIEPDRTASDSSTHLFLRPAVILEPGTRYSVVLRAWQTPDGDPVPVPEAFLALRDRIPTDDPGIAARRPSFESLFEDLDRFGVRRDDLQLAWSFTTSSDESRHGTLEQAIAAARGQDPEGGALSTRDLWSWSATPTADPEDPVDPHLRYRISTTFSPPAVVEPAQVGGAFRVRRDTHGGVIASGTFDTNVLIQVPHAAMDGEPVGVLLYGHGMFGTSWEIAADHLKRFGEEQRWIMVGIPMIGMSSDDGDSVRDAISDLNHIQVLTDGLIQGLVNHHAVVDAIRSGEFADFLADIDPDILVDADLIEWFGASQGGIYGPTLLATSPVMSRGVLAVPGQNYQTMLSRSRNFEPFFLLLDFAFERSVDVTLSVAAVQLLWDRTDPVSYYRRMLDEDNRALLLVSKGDKQVPVLSVEVASRTFGPRLPLLGTYDVDRSPWDTAEIRYPHDGSGVILFDFGNPWPTQEGNLPPQTELSDPHSRIAEVDEVGPVMNTFLRSGVIEDPCGGEPCRFD